MKVQSKPSTLFRHLNAHERAPLPVVIRAVTRAYASPNTDLDAYLANLAVNKTLRDFGWRKRDFCRALRARAIAAGITAQTISQRSVYHLARMS